jgi:Uma2 family endonuclease
MATVRTFDQAPDLYQEIESPNIDHLMTEDDTPVDNIFSEKQQRLGTEPLYASWQGGPEKRLFLAAANVGLFNSVRESAIVPDIFLSLDVQVAENWYEKRHRSYFFWEFGKPPEVVIEIVSNDEGGELGRKLRRYAQMRIEFYVIFDPTQQLSNQVLQIFHLEGQQYNLFPSTWFAEIGLGLRVWEGVYEGKEARWLRWYDHTGELVLTGAERAVEAEERAVEAEERAVEAEDRAKQAEKIAQQEAEARAAAENELARLQAELTRLRGE